MARPRPEPSTPLERRSEEVFLEQSCGGCHTIRGTDADGALGPDLTHLASRRTIACDNPQCVTALESEQRYLSPRFLVIVEDSRLTLRCDYCEHEQVPEFVGRSSTKKFELNRMRWDSVPEDIVLFADEASAIAAGFQPYKHRVNV